MSISSALKSTVSALTGFAGNTTRAILGLSTVPAGKSPKNLNEINQAYSESLSSSTKILGAIFNQMQKARAEELSNRLNQENQTDTKKQQDDKFNEELIKALSIRRKPRKPKKEPTKKEEPSKKEEPKPAAKKVEEKKVEPKPTEKKVEEKKVEPKPQEKKVEKKEEVKPPPEKVPVKEVPKEAVKPPPKEVPKEVPKPTAEKVAPTPPKPATTAGKAITSAAAATALKGRAAQVAVALGTLGITSKAAIGAIVATSAKESGLDPFKPEDGVKPWKATLEKRGVDYLYLKFPQLAKGGRVAKQLNMPDGVPADYIKQIMDKGDEAWFTLVYPGGADAYKYRGRGLIQITGKGVYKSVGDIIGIDLEKDPDAITRDFDTAAKATGAYLMNSLGRGDSKKGLAALNALSDEKESLKVVIANVARGFAGSDKDKIDKMFDPSSNLGKTTASQLEAASKYSQLGSDAASGKQIDQASKENKNLKDSSAPQNKTIVNNTMTPSSEPEADIVVRGNKKDDRSALQRKTQ